MKFAFLFKRFFEEFYFEWVLIPVKSFMKLRS